MTTEETDDDHESLRDRLAAHKRYNMKSLGRLVDSNRLTGVSRAGDVGPSGASRTARDLLGVVDADDPDGRGAPVVAGESSDDADDPRTDGDVAPGPLEPGGSAVDETDRLLAVAEEMNIPIRLSGRGGGGGDAGVDTAGADVVPRNRTGDLVDRSDMGTAVTRSGLSMRLDVSALTAADPTVETPNSLARRMLDGEIGPGGRISDPRDVPGIVLDLAKDVPASVAVSVVRIDEEVEIVGDSIDPSIDPTVFTAAFSGVFRSVRPAAEALQEGPLGKIHDVVIEGERMDLILRPLGAHYFLMVLEDRSDPQANLAATRMRMASIAPGVTAILAQQDGEA